MRFFSRLVFICNCCFVAYVVLRFVELANKKNEQFNGAIKIQPLESTIVILGYGAIIVNLIFNLLLLMQLLLKKNSSVPKWLIWFNFLFLIIQVYYFFFSNF